METYSWEVLYAILAVALRFLDDASSRDDILHKSQRYAEKSLKLVMKTVTEGTVQISTLQALCLLTLIDITGRYNYSAQ